MTPTIAMPKKLTCSPAQFFSRAFGRKVPPPPPPPLPPARTIISSRHRFEEFYPRHGPHDTPLATLYRIYVTILAAKHTPLRNELEYFSNQYQWRVSEIPEPPSSIQDPEQLAVLATIPYLLVKGFNRNIQRGLPRDAPQIMDEETLKEVQSRPKVFERVPKWAELVEPLEIPLVIPDDKGRTPSNSSVEGLDSEMRRKNILTFILPVLFT